MTGRATTACCLLLAGLAACGSQEKPDFTVHDTGVVLRTTAAFARQPDFPARLASTIDAALAYWGGSWDRLNGATITFYDDPAVPCGGASALGCYDGDVRLTTRDPGIGTFPCVEATVLVHEVGHAIIGDPDHTDPRWMDFGGVAAALQGRVGYSSTGEEACTIWPSVWQHILGTASDGAAQTVR